MKKTLSILMLTAGLSVAASAATTLLDQSIVGYSDFDSRIADFGTQRDSVTITTSGDNLLLSGRQIQHARFRFRHAQQHDRFHGPGFVKTQYP